MRRPFGGTVARRRPVPLAMLHVRLAMLQIRSPSRPPLLEKLLDRITVQMMALLQSNLGGTLLAHVGQLLSQPKSCTGQIRPMLSGTSLVLYVSQLLSQQSCMGQR